MGNGQTIPINNHILKIVNTISEGAYGYIDLVVDQNNKKFAMKRMRSQDKETYKIATNEISILKLITPHPNIVQYYGHVEREINYNCNEFYILLEYCPSTLLNVINVRLNIPLKEVEILDYFAPICNAVEHMHSLSPSIIHRDLKLENVLINHHNELKLCDFGSCTNISKIYNTSAEIADLEEQVQKYTTSIYRAPEQVDTYGRLYNGPAVDVWALGCILYYLMFRQHAFPTGASNQIISANYIIEENSHSVYLVNLLTNILQVDPLKRPTAKEVVEALDDLITKDYSNNLLSNRHLPNVKSIKSPSSDANKSKREKPKTVEKYKPILESKVNRSLSSDWDPFEKVNAPSNSNNLDDDDEFDPFQSETIKKLGDLSIQEECDDNEESETDVSVSLDVSVDGNVSLCISPEHSPKHHNKPHTIQTFDADDDWNDFPTSFTVPPPKNENNPLPKIIIKPLKKLVIKK